MYAVTEKIVRFHLVYNDMSKSQYSNSARERAALLDRPKTTVVYPLGHLISTVT